MVGLDAGRRIHLDHRHASHPLQYLGDVAFIIGRQVKNDDKSHAAGRGHPLKKTKQDLQAARRGTETHHRKIKAAFYQLVNSSRVRGSVMRVCHLFSQWVQMEFNNTVEC